MKIKRLLIGMLACSAMVACTNDDVLDNPVDNPVNGADGKAYVSVKLVMTETNTGRATTDLGFDVGTKAEQTISTAADKSIFLFYDKDDKWVTSGQIVNGEVSTPNTDYSDHEGSINDLSGQVYVVLNGPDQSLKKVTQVLTVVNYNGADKLKNLNKDQALDIITDTKANPANSGFLMSTSVYYNDGAVRVTAINPETQICQTQEDAKLNPVKIYIERASAKFQIDWKDSYSVVADGESTDNEKNEGTAETEDDVVVDGKLQAATIKILGYTLNNYNESTNLVKDIASWNDSDNAPFTGWNFANNFRSYWAKGTKYTYEGYKSTLNAEGEEIDITHPLTIHTFEDAKNKRVSDGENNVSYVYEHTVETPNVSEGRTEEIAYPNVTTVLIAAQFSVPDYEGSFYKYGGVFYTENSYLNLISKQLGDAGYFVKGDADDQYVNIPSSSFTIEAIETELAKVKVKVNEGTYYKITSAEGSTTTEAADITDMQELVDGLSYVKEIEAYNDGKCYYQIPIEHLPSAADGFCKYGVVRNHWYQMYINAVKHIGEAVYNEKIEIPQIPQKDTEHYLAAELHVLSWHVVKQDVTLE